MFLVEFQSCTMCKIYFIFLGAQETRYLLCVSLSLRHLILLQDTPPQCPKFPSVLLRHELYIKDESGSHRQQEIASMKGGGLGGGIQYGACPTSKNTNGTAREGKVQIRATNMVRGPEQFS